MGILSMATLRRVRQGSRRLLKLREKRFAHLDSELLHTTWRSKVRLVINKRVLCVIAAQSFSAAVFGAPGDLYQTDFGSGSVFRYTPAGVKTTFAVGLGNPAGLAFDPEGNL